MTEPEPVLSIRRLCISFRTGKQLVPAVEGIDVDVAPGETVAMVGESGSGKSTTASAIMRLLPENGVITAGSIVYDGRDITALGEHELIALRGVGIGLVPQDPMSNLNPLMRVGEQIGEALEAHGRTSGHATRERVIELLDMVGIPDPRNRVNQYPHEFSGGMRQRVLIAIGLACGPRLLIADEPTSALDVTVQRRILDQLTKLTHDARTSVFLITHDVALAAERADRIVVMLKGRLVEEGAPEEIINRPVHEYTRRLVGAVPSLAARKGVTPRPPIPAGTKTLMTVTGVTKVYPVRSPAKGEPASLTAVDDVSFTIPAGATVSLVGESGSGKSTTANMLLGLETMTSGSVSFDGLDLAGLSHRQTLAFRRRVQPVFQNPYSSLDPRFRVEDIIVEPLRVHRIGDKRSRHERVLELLAQVALPESFADRLPHELSGGQRQRVAIARALALKPDLVVLDEAVSALDVLVQAQILRLLADLQDNLHLSYLFISHDLSVVRMISDEVHVMRRGKIVESGTPQELFANPRHPYTQELLAAIPGGR